MQHTSIIETARQYAYSFFNEEETAIILNFDAESCNPQEIRLYNAWYRHYRKKFDELKGVK